MERVPFVTYFNMLTNLSTWVDFGRFYETLLCMQPSPAVVAPAAVLARYAEADEKASLEQYAHEV
jgi:hypothetical protein